MQSVVIILSAGMGTRMQSDLPKVLHNVACEPLLIHSMRTASQIGAHKTIVVTGHGAKDVAKVATSFDPSAEIVNQSEQFGTAHAVDQTRKALLNFDGEVFVLYGDTPFIEPSTLLRMSKERNDGAKVVVLGFNTKRKSSYGRLIISPDGSLEEIVEYKDANTDQRKISFCNSGVICTDSKLLFNLIAEVENNNANNEFYLTDIVKLAKNKNLKCAAVECAENEAMGINSKVELANAETYFQTRKRIEMMLNGVTLIAPETVWFASDTVVGRDTIIEQNVIFGPEATVESHALIKSFSHIEGAHVSKGAIVGPFARLRPGAELANNSKVGNFCEVKKSQVGEGAKINHLSYIGDTKIGDNANIGAGTITCNYDGVSKHFTEIGESAFIGSNNSLVAPVRVGDKAMTASGSVITKDVPNGDLGIARAPQDNKKGFAVKFFKRLKAIKLANKKDL
ncbi:bifunctional UDP-N-acetylglucosamine diphosphorylase/glucosamine-1-phosphate N-acetyltransferase GlmU [Amylibacter sp.]|nr:bifunctional UDP-N-acetylglucosamine diphosphorylase/glucosamine-1-phosphate N-acetyltransferase GlmU [Amylibacter sp.]MDA9248524.1 bifunctional UDP-N-acetylglucosamine diphosphorylase/glucosamine-1-phosphate N-acetyltransferase GlmU [Amylibacter sp.]MDB3864611.1 bifunctional UDP-N-acetylglucosamine diphosphorylase/glucosamine-1-phosphate N-acetyltransferase GlmU [Amylibacter sp.]MDB4008685.1 bifunctional UDP-N-acetylglucosamine diphosphorylase/glucosamine-1-phosphate N-acetyltransferase GlmU